MIAAVSINALGASPDVEDAKKLLASIDIADGVSKEEADLIGQAYFLTHTGCGAYSGITDGESWVVQGYFGYAGSPVEGFTINKVSGEIKSPIGRSYKNPQEMLNSLKIKK